MNTMDMEESLGSIITAFKFEVKITAIEMTWPKKNGKQISWKYIYIYIYIYLLWFSVIVNLIEIPEYF